MLRVLHNVSVNSKHVLKPFNRRFYSTNVIDMTVRVKSLITSRKSGTFTTASMEAKHQENPLYGSIMPYILDPQGKPIIALREDEIHYRYSVQSLFNLIHQAIFKIIPKLL